MSSPSPRLIIAAFEFLGWLFPPPPLDPEIVACPELLKQKAAWWNKVSGSLFLALLIGGSVLFCYLTVLSAASHLAPLGQPLFLIRAEPFELCVWAVFIAFLLTPWACILLLRIGLGKRLYDEFMMVVSHGSPMGGEDGVKVHIGKMMALFFFLFGPLLFAFMVLRIDSYTAFTQDAMRINSMWTLGQETVRPYKDIRGIYSIAAWQARFEDVVKPRHALVFVDGKIWATDDGMRPAAGSGPAVHRAHFRPQRQADRGGRFCRGYSVALKKLAIRPSAAIHLPPEGRNHEPA